MMDRADSLAFAEARGHVRLLLVAALATTWLPVACSPPSSLSPPAGTAPPLATRAPPPTPTIAMPTATVPATLMPTSTPAPEAPVVFHTPTPSSDTPGGTMANTQVGRYPSPSVEVGRR